MSIVDDHLYVDMFSSLAVFDVSDILSPKFKESYTVEDVFDYDTFWNFPFEIWEEPNSYIEYREYPDKTKGIVVDWQTEIVRENEVCTTIVILVIVRYQKLHFPLKMEI